MKAKKPKFKLKWSTSSNLYMGDCAWHAPSPYHDEGSPFMFRIFRGVRNGRHGYIEASDRELRENLKKRRFWTTLRIAKRAIQEDADAIVEAIKLENQ